jgi:spore germination protein YaaH
MSKLILKKLAGLSIIVLLLTLFVVCSGTPGGSNKHKRNMNFLEAVLSETENDNTGNEEYAYISPAAGEALPVSEFGEIWVYVVAGREVPLRGLPLSDIGYFAAEVNTYGKLVNVPKRNNLTFSGRVHVVAVCNGYSLSHFVLAPGSDVRRELITDLVTAAKDFDGLQIDFEYIPARDGEAFQSFIRELRERLPDKMLTIALPARIRKLDNDVNDYEKIKPYVDKILVMAYDEHWSTSKPGSIASLDWCRRVAEYSMQTIGREKLIMGLPFYGRAWADHNPARALVYSSTDNLIKTMTDGEIKRENGIPTFDYEVNVQVKVYYEDEYSLSARMELYKSLNVGAIGFWRLGQETPHVWQYIKLN